MMKRMLWTAVLLAGVGVAGVSAQEPVETLPAEGTEAAPAEAAPVATAPPDNGETPEAFEKRVRTEVNEMDKTINQFKKREGDLTAEQKGALTVYTERKKVVMDRLETIDSADSAQTSSAKASVNASLQQLQDAYNGFVALFNQ